MRPRECIPIIASHLRRTNSHSNTFRVVVVVVLMVFAGIDAAARVSVLLLKLCRLCYYPVRVRVAVNREATIVIDHLIQASDVVHTMQYYWHIYRKWNECLFREMYQAYLEGRAESDPSIFWYKGEIGFLDFYVMQRS